jgi:hypothetical protein
MQTSTLSSAAFAASLISLLGPAVASHDRQWYQGIARPIFIQKYHANVSQVQFR